MEPCGIEPNGYFIKDGVAVIMIIGEIEGHETPGDNIILLAVMCPVDWPWLKQWHLSASPACHL